jgi:hypothetical protein
LFLDYTGGVEELMGWGAVASVAGGLVFSVMMVEVGFLRTVAKLVGGFAVHGAISTPIGRVQLKRYAINASIYGLAFLLALFAKTLDGGSFSVVGFKHGQ